MSGSLFSLLLWVQHRAGVPGLRWRLQSCLRWGDDGGQGLDGVSPSCCSRFMEGGVGAFPSSYQAHVGFPGAENLYCMPRQFGVADCNRGRLGPRTVPLSLHLSPSLCIGGVDIPVRRGLLCSLAALAIQELQGCGGAVAPPFDPSFTQSKAAWQ